MGLAVRGEDAPGVMGPNTRQPARLIGHPLSLHDIREGPGRPFRISAPPPSPWITGGALFIGSPPATVLIGTA